MAEWGFNCGGYGTYPKLKDKMYYIGQVNIVRQGFYLLDNYDFPDVFDESFERSTEDKFKEARDQFYDPKKLIGLVWSDTPAWNIFKSRSLRHNDWVSAIRNLGPDSPGKKAYTGFLMDRYKDDLNKLVEYYRLPDSALNDLENYDFTTLYLGHPCIIEDDEIFLTKIAERYYCLGAKYQKEYLPGIPILGDRYLLGDHPDHIIKTASKYIDAVSVQVGDGYGETMLPSYPFPGEELFRCFKLAEKPVLIGDHQISFSTESYDRTIFSQAGDEQTASDETTKFLTETYSQDYICGYFRCTYIDKIAEQTNMVEA